MGVWEGVERRDYFVKGVRERVGVRSIENDLYVSVFQKLICSADVFIGADVLIGAGVLIGAKNE